MIDSIEIRNYRNLKELKINSFARVNLITGKNNVGKSSLLEAIAIYVSKADLSMLYELLNERGEYYNQPDKSNNFLGTNEKTLSSIFSDRKTSYNKENGVIIRIKERGNSETTNALHMHFVYYIEESNPQIENGSKIFSTGHKIKIIDEGSYDDIVNYNLADYHIGFVIELVMGMGGRVFLSLESANPLLQNYKIPVVNNIQFIRTRNIEKENNGKLWDSVTLTPKEEYVIDALKIIEPNTERIAFIDDSSVQRRPIIKLKNNNNLFPIKSMGDGINRIFTIILAMVNAENGYLLIDEFENGLHHTVQTKLWEIIFKLSERLNVQVFATTHSNDSIRSFEQVLNSKDDKTLGKFIRLDYKKGQIRETELGADDLEVVVDHNIEMR